jgi:vanillate O-demethylase monooxygenase subunit
MEDKFIIEGQQEMLDADPEFKMHGIVSDAPLAHFRRTLGKLIDAERVEAIDSGREALRRDTVQV